MGITVDQLKYVQAKANEFRVAFEKLENSDYKEAALEVISWILEDINLVIRNVMADVGVENVALPLKNAKSNLLGLKRLIPSLYLLNVRRSEYYDDIDKMEKFLENVTFFLFRPKN
jgi:hypothetical protein